MSPFRYLGLRRMHLAHRALILADAAKTTVTGIATDHGFWELGRFSIEYRKLFGESPSATLHRPPGTSIAFQLILHSRNRFIVHTVKPTIRRPRSGVAPLIRTSQSNAQ